MAYTKKYSKPYSEGWKNLPDETTPITAETLDAKDNVLLAIETQLEKTTAIYDEMSVNLGRRTDTGIGMGSFAYGDNIEASGTYSHAEGSGTKAKGNYSHTEGAWSEASGECSHAEGSGTKAKGNYSHTEGAWSEASGEYSHTEGAGTKAKGVNSHAEGGATIATGACQHVQGQFNVEDTENQYAHIVGGASDTDRRNIHTLDWDGNAFFAGNVTGENGKKLSTNDYTNEEKAKVEKIMFVFGVENGIPYIEEL